MVQGGDGGAWDGDPVYMQSIRGAFNPRLLGPVELVKLAVTQADIESIGGPGWVVVLACGAHVVSVVGVSLHPHHEPGLSGGVVEVVDGLAAKGRIPAVAADAALRGCHAGCCG